MPGPIIVLFDPGASRERARASGAPRKHIVVGVAKLSARRAHRPNAGVRVRVRISRTHTAAAHCCWGCLSQKWLKKHTYTENTAREPVCAKRASGERANGSVNICRRRRSRRASRPLKFVTESPAASACRTQVRGILAQRVPGVR